MSCAAMIAKGWELVSKGDWDTLIADYKDEAILVIPGQNDVIEGASAIHAALSNLGAAVPPGFTVTGVRQVGDGEDVVSVVDWKSDKIPGGTQSSVLFRIADGKIYEERWFVDTEQWKAAF
ncbi:nuclear transport factor 2 family protein [Roseovarius sp.]|uniref:nuclear transport factor 2 family protein n=1 Tax=Roseovarius sp. TaxID=1486281 RepID=UPI0025F27A05|nr:nuclear transport factor 2 family protein [Roseovarius sp.]